MHGSMFYTVAEAVRVSRSAASVGIGKQNVCHDGVRRGTGGKIRGWGWGAARVEKNAAREENGVRGAVRVKKSKRGKKQGRGRRSGGKIRGWGWGAARPGWEKRGAGGKRGAARVAPYLNEAGGCVGKAAIRPMVRPMIQPMVRTMIRPGEDNAPE